MTGAGGRSFILEPFPGEKSRPDVTIAGSIGRRGNRWSILWTLSGDLSALSIPAPADSPKRYDRLWEGTCFELFLGEKGSARYREINLSPVGHWNVYRFTGYREGMRREAAFRSLPFRVRTGADGLRLSLRFDTGAILPADAIVEVGIAAVLESARSGKSHWALRHPGFQPDFHRREAFTIRL